MPFDGTLLKPFLKRVLYLKLHQRLIYSQFHGADNNINSAKTVIGPSELKDKKKDKI